MVNFQISFFVVVVVFLTNVYYELGMVFSYTDGVLGGGGSKWACRGHLVILSVYLPLANL